MQIYLKPLVTQLVYEFVLHLFIVMLQIFSLFQATCLPYDNILT